MKLRLTGSSMVNLGGTVVILYLVVLLAQTIKHNYDMGKQVDSLKAQISMLQDQKDELSYNIQYYKTESFQEREARAKLGLQMPGEGVVILPQSSTTNPKPLPDKPTPKPKSNLQQWLDFLRGTS